MTGECYLHAKHHYYSGCSFVFVLYFVSLVYMLENAILPLSLFFCRMMSFDLIVTPFLISYQNISLFKNTLYLNFGQPPVSSINRPRLLELERRDRPVNWK